MPEGIQTLADKFTSIRTDDIEQGTFKRCEADPKKILLKPKKKSVVQAMIDQDIAEQTMKSKLDTENDQIMQATAIGLSAILGTQTNQGGVGMFEKLKA